MKVAEVEVLDGLSLYNNTYKDMHCAFSEQYSEHKV